MLTIPVRSVQFDGDPSDWFKILTAESSTGASLGRTSSRTSTYLDLQRCVGLCISRLADDADLLAEWMEHCLFSACIHTEHQGINGGAENQFAKAYYVMKGTKETHPSIFQGINGRAENQFAKAYQLQTHSSIFIPENKNSS